MMLSVVKGVQGGFSFCGAAKMFAEDSTKGMQICEDAQEKNDNLRSNKSSRNKSMNYSDNLLKNT